MGTRMLKNEHQQHEQSASSLPHLISRINIHKLVFGFLICGSAAATLALILSYYNVKSYVTAIYDPVLTNVKAEGKFNHYFPTPPPPSPTVPKSPPPSQLAPAPAPAPANHMQMPIQYMEDEELLRKASKQPQHSTTVNPKVAFLFLTKQGLPLRLLWEKFFQGHDGLFSIYVHASPSDNGTVPESSIFHRRWILSKEVQWGKFSMVEAERRLLANALLDSSNKRFVLLSEATIPLFNFSTIYTYLTNSSRSFVEVFDADNAVGRGRYDHRMSPTVTLEQWRKGSQWFEMDRDLALRVVSDQIYFPVFSAFCQPPCYGDEHYLPTFVNIVALDSAEGRTVTWADWSRPGPHPGSFSGEQVTEEFLNRIRTGSRCRYNGSEISICFLFARKFRPDALDVLLRLAPTVLGLNRA